MGTHLVLMRRAPLLRSPLNGGRGAGTAEDVLFAGRASPLRRNIAQCAAGRQRERAQFSTVARLLSVPQRRRFAPHPLAELLFRYLVGVFRQGFDNFANAIKMRRALCLHNAQFPCQLQRVGCGPQQVGTR